MNKNIVLIGMAAVGKTSVGKKIAQKHSREFIEMDNEIVNKIGISIPEIIKNKGWDYFRDVESETINTITDRTNIVISTGGGAILRGENVDALKKNGTLFLLTAPLKALIDRIKKSDVRPLFANKDRIDTDVSKLLKSREKLYLDSCDEVIKTDDKTVDEIADFIIKIFTEKYDY